VNPGLLFLARRGLQGRGRQLRRRVRTAKGALSLGAAALFFLLVVASQLFAWAQGAGTAFAPDDLRATVPPLLLLLALLGGISGRALYFTPAEVDFLFAAPVERRELLVYNLVSRLAIQLLSGLWAALFVVRHLPSVAGGVAGVLLGFVFAYVTAQLAAVAGTALLGWLPPAARRVLPWALVAAGVALLGVAAGAPGAGPGVGLGALARSAPVRALSLVARPYAELMAAGSVAAGVGWAAVSLGVIAAEVRLMMLFDAAYAERSLVVSRRTHQRLERLRTGGTALSAAAPSRLRIRPPPLPFLGPAAPLARRQLAELARNPRAVLVPLGLAGLWMAGIAAAARDDAGVAGVLVAAVCVVLPVMFSPHIPFDFRRDLDRVAFLRSLPLSPLAVAAGEVFTVALVFVLFDYATIGVGAATGALTPGWAAALALGVPPLVWAVVSLDNAMFLLMPYRVGAAGEENVQFFGKAMLGMLVKMAVLAVLSGVGLLAMWGVSLTGLPLAAGLAGAWLVLAAGCVPLTWLVGRAFAGFDLATDTPA